MTEAQQRKLCAREGTRKALELKRARSKSLHMKLELEAGLEVLARLELLLRARLQPPLLRPPGARGHAMLRVRPRPRLDPPFQWRFLTGAVTSTIERRRPAGPESECQWRLIADSEIDSSPGPGQLETGSRL
jgi:hypothetical protein